MKDLMALVYTTGIMQKQKEILLVGFRRSWAEELPVMQKRVHSRKFLPLYGYRSMRLLLTNLHTQKPAINCPRRTVHSM